MNWKGGKAYIIHINLHSCKYQHEIDFMDGSRLKIKLAGKGCWKIEAGEWVFITQNPETSSEWADLSRKGKWVTQVKRNGKWYGVMVSNTGGGEFRTIRY